MIVFGVQCIEEKVAKKFFEGLLVFVKGMWIMFHLRVGFMPQMNVIR